MATTDTGRPIRPPRLRARRLLRALALVALALLLGGGAGLAVWRGAWPEWVYPQGYLDTLTSERWGEARPMPWQPPRAEPALEPLPTGLWSLRAIRAQEAWQHLDRQGVTGEHPAVGIYDGWVDAGHRDLRGAMAAETGASPLLAAARWLARDGHGTALAGSIAGRGLPGMTGVDPQARLLPFSMFGGGDRSLGAALRQFADQGVRAAVVALATPDPLVTQAEVDAARSRGVLLVTGLYNRPTDEQPHPAALERTLVVAGHGLDGAPMFGFGELLDLRAPAPLAKAPAPQFRLGPLVLGDPYQRFCCNSAAVAITAGAISLLLTADPTLTPDQVELRLKGSAIRPEGTYDERWTPERGYGWLDAQAALGYDRVGPHVQGVVVQRAPVGWLVSGTAVDEPSSGISPLRARDRHLVGVPVSNVARVQVRSGAGPWVDAALTTATPPTEGAAAYAVAFTAQLTDGGPVTVRAWDTAGNLGPETTPASPSG